MKWVDKRDNSATTCAIIEMPEGYYSGDKPNPHLKEFVEAHIRERPYDPRKDDYDVPPFDKPITTTKATAIYNMHTYWSKKPHDAIREYIKHYTKPGDLVLDPFCGSGGTALAALMEGRKAIAIDRSPAATFITKNYCTPVDVKELKQAFEELKRKVKPEIDWLYDTRCDRCGGKAMTAYTVYSQVFRCPRCLEKVPLFDCVEVDGETKAGKPKKIRVCPNCRERGIEEEIKTTGERFGSMPVLVSYICENDCKPARDKRQHNDPDPKKREYFDKYDLEKIGEIEEKEIPYWYPPHKMMNVEDDSQPWGVKWRAGTSNFRTVVELFTKRNLWALAIFKQYLIEISDELPRGAIEFCWTSVILNLSRMTTNRDRLGYLKGTYYIPQIHRCTNVMLTVENKLNMMLSGWKTLAEIKSNNIIISTDDARFMMIPANSVDYIFTDPPYAEKEQYGELNFAWEAWLDFDTLWHDGEIIINEIRGKTETDWSKDMHQAISECYRVLKPGRCVSLCYHDTSEGTWALIQDLMAESGFIPENIDSAIYIDTGQKSYNQKVADKVNKRDLLVNFRKPKPGEAASEEKITDRDLEDFFTFKEKVSNIVRDYLTAHPGSTKDRIYDEVVSRMVRKGEMEPHKFDDILSLVADAVHPEGEARSAARWYLKEREMEIVDTAESAKEEEAAEVIQKFIKGRLEDYPEDEGVHYSDIFEHYIYAVKDKPRSKLADWLLDYFFKTEAGTYRLPESEEEERLKSEGRGRGVNRRIKRYLSFLEHAVPVPENEMPSDATLADWIRSCKRSGMYLEGKLLYELGGVNLDNLSEEDQVNLEEDYSVCVRALERIGGEGKHTKSKRGSKQKKLNQKKVQEGLESWQ